MYLILKHRGAAPEWRDRSPRLIFGRVGRGVPWRPLFPVFSMYSSTPVGSVYPFLAEFWCLRTRTPTLMAVDGLGVVGVSFSARLAVSGENANPDPVAPDFL